MLVAEFECFLTIIFAIGLMNFASSLFSSCIVSWSFTVSPTRVGAAACGMEVEDERCGSPSGFWAGRVALLSAGFSVAVLSRWVTLPTIYGGRCSA